MFILVFWIVSYENGSNSFLFKDSIHNFIPNNEKMDRTLKFDSVYTTIHRYIHTQITLFMQLFYIILFIVL